MEETYLHRCASKCAPVLEKREALHELSTKISRVRERDYCQIQTTVKSCPFNPSLRPPLLNPEGIEGEAQEAEDGADTQRKKSKTQQSTNPIHSRGQVGTARLGEKEAHFSSKLEGGSFPLKGHHHN